jgi:thiamine pyrophosphokinase
MPAEEAVESVPKVPPVVLCTGGERPPTAVADHLPSSATVIAADSGVDLALALGLHVDLAVGDFDSVAAGSLDAVRTAGGQIEAHPVDKDHTDLELGLRAARSLGAEAVTVVGGTGGRLDHLLANLAVLASPDYAAMTVDAWMGRAHVVVIRPGAPVALHGSAGDVVSLLPMGGPADGVRTEGLLFPLGGETLSPGTSRGVSNRLLGGTEAKISLAAGTLLAIVPEALA